MSVISDDHVSKAVAYLCIDPHPFAVATKAQNDAEDEMKEVWARAFLEADGSVETRKAIATIDADYRLAKEKMSNAVLEKERHRARQHAADMIIEVWRTENANARIAEKVR